MKIQRLFTTILTFLVIALVVAGFGYLLWRWIAPYFENLRNRDNNEIVAFHDHFDLNPAMLNIVLEGERLRDIAPPIIHNGTAHLPVCFIRAHIDPFIFWDEGAQKLFITTRNDMRTYRHGDIRVTADRVYVPTDLFMQLYPYTVAFYPEFNMLVVTDDRTPQMTAAVSERTPVRYRPEAAAPMTARLDSGERVTLFYEENGWTRVRISNGLLGYVQASSLGTAEAIPAEVNRTPIFTDFVDNLQPRTPNWTGGKINLIWKNPYNQDAVNISMETPLHESLTVVSPTWFRFNAETGSLDSVDGTAAYMEWAHAQGVQVWPNVNDTLAGREGIRAILSDEAARRHIIEQLVDFTDTLNLDGLCINIEHLFDYQYGPYFVQFMRELNIALGERVVIMAAMKTCPFINAHYRHDLIALTIDFIALMTYDEHAGNSPDPGPVASLPWVERHITEMLRRVPANQLLLGLPYFNRVWRTSVSEGTPRTHGNWGMDRAVEEFARRDVSWKWDEVIGSYYAEFAQVVDGETLRHQLWLECPRSINEKIQIFIRHNLAGVAGWSMGFTNEALWDLLGTYFS